MRIFRTNEKMFDFIYVWIGKLISLFNSFTGNYILALLIFAVVAKLIFIPFDIKQQKNSIKQAQMRPKEMAIRNKYKGRTDRATQMKMQQEVQDLYQREGYSPFSGCLPMLIQFPIIIVLYGVIRQPLTYISGMGAEAVNAMAAALNSIFETTTYVTGDQIPMIAAIKDLAGENITAFTDAVTAVAPDFAFDSFVSGLPNFEVFGINLGYSPQAYKAIAGSFFHILLIVPILNFVVQFCSTKIMKRFQPQPVVNDPSQKSSMAIMEFTLPLMTVYFAYVMSAAIGVYWIFQNIISLFERFIISKAMPLPKYSEEDIKEMEKAAKAAAKNRQAASGTSERASGEKPRSLHRIDEDDDDEPAPVQKKKTSVTEEDEEKKADKATTSESEKKNAAIADKVIGDAPKLKDESDKYNSKKKK